MGKASQPEKLVVGTNRREIAVLRDAGASPGLFWMQGFKSEMTGLKAEALSEWARRNGHACTRFDYSGHGQSSGCFENGTVSDWLTDSAAVFDQKTEGPQVIVGSSMGGYLALLLAKQMQASLNNGTPGRIAGMILIAPAWNMTEELMWTRASAAAKRAIIDNGVWYRPSQYGDPYPITRRLIEDGRRNLLAKELWQVGCPVDIVHGRLDPDVPFSHSERLVGMLGDSEVDLIEVADGEHRLSRPQDLRLILASVAKMIERAARPAV